MRPGILTFSCTYNDLTSSRLQIADVVPKEHRGVALSIYSLAPLLGPVIGPVAGGFLAEAKGWRWDFWALAIAAGALTLISLFVIEETYPVIILERKTARLRKQTGNQALRSKLAPSGDGSATQHFLRCILRPTKMLIKSPIVLFLALYAGLAYGYQYLMLSTFTYVFEERYNFSTGVSGLSFLGLGVGSVLGLSIGPLSDRFITPKKEPGEDGSTISPKPEARLIPLAYTALFIPAGFSFTVGRWNTESTGLRPSSGLASSALAFSLYFLYNYLLRRRLPALCCQCTCCQRPCPQHRRGFVATRRPKLVWHTRICWGNSLLGFLALGMVPITLALLKYGERLRLKFDVGKL